MTAIRYCHGERQLPIARELVRRMTPAQLRREQRAYIAECEEDGYYDWQEPYLRLMAREIKRRS